MTPESERPLWPPSWRVLLIGYLIAGIFAILLLLAFAAHSQEIATSDPALICGKVNGMSYSRQHRKLLLEDERRADFARWNVPWSEHRNYELDHWQPLDIGGADTPANRRPQRCDRWEGDRCVVGPAAVKDAVEAEAGRDICRVFRIDPEIAARHIKEWQKHFANWKDW